MFSIYQTTRQGVQTRSRILALFHPHEELTREDLIQRSDLTYDQIRRQTKNLCIEGKLTSHYKNGKRAYRLR